MDEDIKGNIGGVNSLKLRDEGDNPAKALRKDSVEKRGTAHEVRLVSYWYCAERVYGNSDG